MANPDDRYLIRVETPAVSTVEIVRSFGYKLFLQRYDSRDFFCSQKVTCKMEDAQWAAEAAQEFCEMEVLAAVKAYKHKWEQQQSKKQKAEGRAA